jgi:putative ubiquitin-RnfH superfamily antitoxin RatB of RatAB toxin-antitoxin module
MAEAPITVEVVYAKPEQQALVTLRMESGATAEQAIAQSGLLQRFPEIDPSNTEIGIFSKVCTLDRPLQNGDRVEIYRPLFADPKDLRRQRAAKAI